MDEFVGKWRVEAEVGGSWEPLPGSAGYWLHCEGYLTCRRLLEPDRTYRLVDKFGQPREPIGPGDVFPKPHPKKGVAA